LTILLKQLEKMIFHNKLFIIYSIFRCDHVSGCTNVTISTLSGERGKKCKMVQNNNMTP